MTRQVFYLNKTCMDCGKDFLAVIEEGTGKPLYCWYWGSIDLRLKYQWFIRVDFEKWDKEKDRPVWQRWLKAYIPAYYYPDEEVTVKSIYERWYLLLRGWLDRTPEIEMWTREECKEKEELANG